MFRVSYFEINHLQVNVKSMDVAVMANIFITKLIMQKLQNDIY